MGFEKLFAIIIFEIVETLMFITILIAISSFPEFLGKEEVITWAFSIWLLAGLSTPFITEFELWNLFSKQAIGNLIY